MQRPERVWPFDSTRLERIAFRAGLDADEVREWLRAEIDRRSRKGRRCPELTNRHDYEERPKAVEGVDEGVDRGWSALLVACHRATLVPADDRSSRFAELAVSFAMSLQARCGRGPALVASADSWPG